MGHLSFIKSFYWKPVKVPAQAGEPSRYTFDLFPRWLIGSTVPSSCNCRWRILLSWQRRVQIKRPAVSTFNVKWKGTACVFCTWICHQFPSCYYSNRPSGRLEQMSSGGLIYQQIDMRLKHNQILLRCISLQPDYIIFLYCVSFCSAAPLLHVLHITLLITPVLYLPSRISYIKWINSTITQEVRSSPHSRPQSIFVKVRWV